MKKYIYLASILAAGVSLSSCDDLIKPGAEPINNLEAFNNDPTHAYGVLAQTYSYFSFPDMPESDFATDDAVSNNKNDGWVKAATGSWTSQNNPVSKWNDYYYAIQTINLFLDNASKVVWYAEADQNALQLDHFIGEAHALRAIFNYYLLMQHAGKVNGELTGILIHDAPEDASTDFNQARASFADSYKAIIADLDDAIMRLPDQYRASWRQNEIPQRLLDMGATTSSMARINGTYSIGHLDGRICKVYKALVSLMAASPAYNAETWENAANNAKVVINSIGGVDAFQKYHLNWFIDADYLSTVTTSAVPAISIWYNGKSEDNGTENSQWPGWEKLNYPPSMNGLGRCNPSQNLVDAFPMANGYPISDPASGYDPNNPYANRDPRLNWYILCDGGSIGTTVISTVADADNLDGYSPDATVATRTGYYMKKFLNPVASPSATAPKKGTHVKSRVRTIEAYLTFAESANEAWGPTSGSPSAYDVIKKIREEAGITDGDKYLESIKGDQAKMRDLIRNERRLCLCFENKRFWDLRRWNDTKLLKEPVKGVKITGSGSNKKYDIVEVEPRKYEDYQIYCPIPYSEVVRYSNLKQNDNWK